MEKSTFARLIVLKGCCDPFWRARVVHRWRCLYIQSHIGPVNSFRLKPYRKLKGILKLGIFMTSSLSKDNGGMISKSSPLISRGEEKMTPESENVINLNFLSLR